MSRNAVVEVTIRSPQGHKNEFVFGLRLTASAAELHEQYKSCEDVEHKSSHYNTLQSRAVQCSAEVDCPNSKPRHFGIGTVFSLRGWGEFRVAYAASPAYL